MPDGLGGVGSSELAAMIRDEGCCRDPMSGSKTAHLHDESTMVLSCALRRGGKRIRTAAFVHYVHNSLRKGDGDGHARHYLSAGLESLKVNQSSVDLLGQCSRPLPRPYFTGLTWALVLDPCAAKYHAQRLKTLQLADGEWEA